MRRSPIWRALPRLCCCVVLSLLVLLGGFPIVALAQQFNSGSTGTNGPFHPIAVPAGTTAITLSLSNGVVTFAPGGNTATLPNTPQMGFVDGTLFFTTFNLPADVTLTFLRHPANPPVTILAQGNVTIAGTIDNFTGTRNGTVSTGGPSPLFLPSTPTVDIVSVGGVAVSPFPTGGFGGVDVMLPSPGIFPIVLEASQVPVGTTISVTAKPESDGQVLGPVMSPALTGSFDSSTATVNFNFPAAGVYFLEARVNFTLP